MASSMETIQKILQETVAPGISDLRERLTRVEVEIKRLDDKIDSKHNEVLSEIRRIDDKLTTALEIRERLAALEARMAAR